VRGAGVVRWSSFLITASSGTSGPSYSLLPGTPSTVSGRNGRRNRSGSTAATEDHRTGHSWTEDIEVAKQFQRLRGWWGFRPTLWSALVDPSRLLARLEDTRPGEPHYVIETEALEITAAAPGRRHA
jgi:hypothetical protein